MAAVADRLFARRYGHRAIVLETIAAVPGMVAAMLLHLHSLRSLENDYGWIHALLDEAENERMHLMTFAAIARPVWWERALIVVAQATFFGGYLIVYVAAPGFAHRLVGYLEEQAIISYTDYLAELAATGGGDRPAPAVALKYWDLPDHATLRDVITIIRDEECHHRDVNHELSDQVASGHRKQPDG
jgi:ubiquinol oxidase